MPVKESEVYFLLNNKNYINTSDTLIVSHISRSSTEFCIRFYNFVDGFEKVFFRSYFTPGPDGKHTGFCTHTANFST